jgi:hypothetical protein
MARLLVKKKLAMVVALNLARACYAAEDEHTLKTNPFERPLNSQENSAQSIKSEREEALPFVLRGTMVAGKQSLADISGLIVPLGNEVNGYRLVAVHQREVILLKNDERRILSVDGTNEGK